MGDIFITSYFAQYFDGEERRYFFYDNLYDENGVINDEVLTLTLNKINKFLECKTCNVYILDPNSYIETFKKNENINNAMLYLDRTKYKSIIDTDNTNSVFNFDLKTMEAFQRASVDLGVNYNLYSFYDLLKSESKDAKNIYFILEKDFYFLMAVDNGHVEKYFYDDRSFYNDRAKRNIEENAENITEDEIYENLDFELLASVLGGLLEDLDSPSDYNLKLIPYNISDNTKEYLSTFAFKNLEIIKYFDIPRVGLNSDQNLLNNSKKKVKSPLLTILFVSLLAIFIFEIYYMQSLKSNLENLYEEYEIIENQRIDNLISKDNNIKNQEDKLSMFEDYEQTLSSYQLLNGEKIIDILEELNLGYEIINARVVGGELIVTINSSEGLDKKYSDKVTKIKNMGDTAQYELSFEVGNAEY
ncbi:hypothetical protein [Ezakiella peruensis]|uniref:hypothetical protein n=1 Tax=Ezakiella peruensis TaxID=1464038 RepID=UPI000C1B1B3E|nr:hypothetical protein [Ezakiella peruensis]